ANPFVASFVGRANFLDGRVVERDGERGFVRLDGGARWRVRLHTNDAVGADVRVMVRPEALRLADLGRGPGDDSSLSGRVLGRRFAGAGTVYRVAVSGAPDLVVTIPGHGGSHQGDVEVTAEEDPPPHAFPRDLA